MTRTWAAAADAKKATTSVANDVKLALAVDHVVAAAAPELVAAKDAMAEVDMAWRDLHQREKDLEALMEATGGATVGDDESADESDGDDERDAVLAPSLSTRRIDEAKIKAQSEALTWVNEASKWAPIVKVRHVLAKATDAERKAADHAAKRAEARSRAIQPLHNNSCMIHAS